MWLYWLFFACLSVVASLTYNVSMKLGSGGTNAFGFTFIIASTIFAVQTLCCLTARYVFKMDVFQGMNMHVIKYAALAGIGSVLIDISCYFAFYYGSTVSTQVFRTIGGTIALAIFSALFLGESMTTTKALGIAFGICAVLLITKQS